jgi:catechol 2,3-dioxygenase-like lactoylglutathione lyase family enzyme/predicted enzyme related to lactoylglutathione lyase
MRHLVFAAGHVKMNARDMDAVVHDATEILGLRVTRTSKKETWLSSNGRMVELVIRQSDENSCHTIGLEALTVEDVEEVASRIDGAGCRILSRSPSFDCCDAGVTFATPEGLRFEVHTPTRDAMYNPRYQTNGIKPRRLDHYNIISPDPVATRTQLTQICGMQLSERMVNDALSWMYGGNRQHHIMGIVKGDAPGIHHYSFEFEHFSDYCRLGDILDTFDRQLIWGPGRHRPGDNTYAYYFDASGAIVECSGPMHLVADEAHFEPNVITNLERPGNVRQMNVWGSPAPQEWREHFFPFTSIE